MVHEEVRREISGGHSEVVLEVSGRAEEKGFGQKKSGFFWVVSAPF